jgi:hypothetical protein
MSDDVQYQNDWPDKTTSCRNCNNFQSHDGRNACVPSDKTFEQAVEEYGEVNPDGHCNYFTAKV